MLADNALTTLERMKIMLGLPNVSDERNDFIIEMLINKASSSVERQIGRNLKKQKYVEKHYADGQQELVTKEYPITEVIYIKENGELIAPQLYDYKQQGNIGVIYKDTGWLNAGYRKGLSYDKVFSTKNIEVCYVAGYTLPKDATDDELQTLPADLEGLIWGMVAQAYTNMQNGAHGLKSFSISDVSWHFNNEVNPEWDRIINLYRRY